jgi:sporulation and cell division protein SsgA
MRSIRTVSTDLVLWLVAPQQTVRPLVARFIYSREDPYAIRVAFRVEQDKLVEWVFARDLLSMGMRGREGLGDVTVWPSSGAGVSGFGRVVNIEISSPFGRAHFEVSVKEIAEFLRYTCQIVPAGEESELMDFEDELTDLLRGGVG